MVKIRLQRAGKKKAPFYHIVVADSRSPRDGKIIEQIGTYNPMVEPSELKLDKELLRVARIKSKDMVDNNYFSHTSPTYGTPFQMIKNFGISYRSAGENIAGNSTAKKAFDAWMNSSGHKANILGNSFTATGIGVVDSPVYGKILTQMFIGK